MLIFYSALKCIFKMRCLHRIPVTVIKAYADCLIQNICLSIMIIEFMHLHHRLKYDQMLKLPSAHKHGHCQTLHILTLNKTRVLPGLERHDPQACKRWKYTREQVKYISIFTTWKYSEKIVSVLIGVHCNLCPALVFSRSWQAAAFALTWWLDSITCDRVDLMSLPRSLHLFEHLRGNCVTS